MVVKVSAGTAPVYSPRQGEIGDHASAGPDNRTLAWA
ncbi:hypothetical protein BJY24_004085 [Nocardia transvalensis]|uniref:Uncharacterized protein n=1 Tax=Nocardia transvalensis TaxID=37333 RepID=A0A7W9PGJ1_9NOCA|nr:hypothetical protein [Nocardia transvalensis]